MYKNFGIRKLLVVVTVCFLSCHENTNDNNAKIIRNGDVFLGKWVSINGTEPSKGMPRIDTFEIKLGGTDSSNHKEYFVNFFTRGISVRFQTGKMIGDKMFDGEHYYKYDEKTNHLLIYSDSLHPYILKRD